MLARLVLAAVVAGSPLPAAQNHTRIVIRLPVVSSVAFGRTVAAFVAESLAVTAAAPEAGLIQSKLETTRPGARVTEVVTARITVAGLELALVELSGIVEIENQEAMRSGTGIPPSIHAVSVRTHPGLWARMERVAYRLRQWEGRLN